MRRCDYCLEQKEQTCVENRGSVRCSDCDTASEESTPRRWPRMSRAIPPWAILLSVASGMIVPIALVAWVKANQIGPRAFWAVDACPELDVVCGTFSLVFLLATLVGVVLILVPTLLWPVGGGSA